MAFVHVHVAKKDRTWLLRKGTKVELFSILISLYPARSAFCFVKDCNYQLFISARFFTFFWASLLFIVIA